MSKELFNGWRKFLKEQSEVPLRDLPGATGRGYSFKKSIGAALGDKKHPVLGLMPPYHLKGKTIQPNLNDPVASKYIKVAVKEISDCIKDPAHRMEFMAPFLDDKRAIRRDIWGRGIGTGVKRDMDSYSAADMTEQEVSERDLQIMYAEDTENSLKIALEVIGNSAYLNHNSPLLACDIASKWSKVLKQRDKQIELFIKNYSTPGEIKRKDFKGLSPVNIPTPSNKDFVAAGFIEFKGNDTVQIKNTRINIKGGRKVNYGQKVMINFLNSFSNNPALKNYAPWYVEDISRESGGDTVEHGSHEWGLDVDISIPVKTAGSHPGDPNVISSKKATGRQAVGRKSRKKGAPEAWNFYDVEPNELNLDGCIEFLKHCFFGKYREGWRVRAIYLDKKLIKAIKGEIRRRVNPADKNYDSELDLRARKDVFVGKKKALAKDDKLILKLMTRLQHAPKHQNHFHVRLFAPGTKSEQMKVFDRAYSVPKVGSRYSATADPTDVGLTRKAQRKGKVKVRDPKTGKVIKDPKTGEPKYTIGIIDLKKKWSSAYGPARAWSAVSKEAEGAWSEDIDTE